jgi:hypothetical protein
MQTDSSPFIITHKVYRQPTTITTLQPTPIITPQGPLYTQIPHIENIPEQYLIYGNNRKAIVSKEIYESVNVGDIYPRL